MPKPKQWYTPEFKAEAVRLAKSGNKSVTQTAKDLGIALESLRKWVRKLRSTWISFPFLSGLDGPWSREVPVLSCRVMGAVPTSER